MVWRAARSRRSPSVARPPNGAPATRWTSAPSRCVDARAGGSYNGRAGALSCRPEHQTVEGISFILMLASLLSRRRVAGLLLVLLMLLAGCLGQPSVPDPTPTAVAPPLPPVAGRIAFLSDRSGQRE